MRGIATIILYLAASHYLPAQNLGFALADMIKNFNGIHSIHTEETIVQVCQKPYLEIEPATDLSITRTFKFNSWEEGAAFKYDLSDETPGNAGLMASQAYDGKTDQFFNPVRGGILTISQESMPNGKIWLDRENFLFQPYAFLCPDEGRKRAYFSDMPSLPDVLNPKLWQRIAGIHNVSFTQSATGDNAVLTFTEPGAKDDKPFYSSEVTFEVYLSKALGYFPVGYKKRNKANVVVQDSFVTEIGKINKTSLMGGGFLLYPKKVVYHGYNDKGELMMTQQASIDKISINDIEDGSDVFYIDPSSAQFIYDYDKIKWINVPR